MSKFFDFDNEQTKREKQIKRDLRKAEETGKLSIQDNAVDSSKLNNYEKCLEHMSGMYDCMNLVSKYLNVGADILFEKNIIYLDRLSSSDFYIHPAFTKRYIRTQQSGKEVESEQKYNPFICCKYDFFARIDWARAYVYGNYLYFVAENKKVESVTYRDIKHFTLAIYCDNPEKMNIFTNQEFIDIRLIKMDVFEDEDDNGEETQLIDTSWEENYAEKTIPIMVLNEENAYLVESTYQKEFDQEREAYLAFMRTRSEDLDKTMGQYDSQLMGSTLSQFYHIALNNSAKSSREEALIKLYGEIPDWYYKDLESYGVQEISD